MDSAATAAWATSLLREIYKPRPKGGVIAWARENVWIPTSISPEFGDRFYDIEVTPIAEILAHFYDSPDYDEFFGPKSSQSGYSQLAHVCALHSAHFIGKDILLNLDSREEAGRVSKKRLQPLLRHCDALKGQIDEGGDGITTFTIFLKGLVFYLSGSFSASALANKTIGLAIADEVDNYPPEIRGESNAIDLIRDRLKKVIGSKLMAFSKPRNSDDIIWPEYLAGTRHKLFIPCPSCSDKAGEPSGFQDLVWENVVFGHCRGSDGAWDYSKVLHETFYRCRHCGEPIREEQKPWMMRKEHRDWRATNTGHDQWKPKPRVMSAHASDLYSLFPKDTWGKLAVEWLDAQHSPSKKLRFKRGRLGLPDEKHAIEVTASEVKAMVGGYRRGELPRPVAVIVQGNDVQKETVKWVKAGFDLDGNCWVIDYDENATFSSLVEEAKKPVRILKDSGGAAPTVRKALVDERDGNRRPEIRDFVISTMLGVTEDGLPDYLFYPCYGLGGLGTRNFRDMAEPQNVTHSGYPLISYRFNDWAFKGILYGERIQRFREFIEAERQRKPAPSIPRLWFPADCGDDFFKEFESEEQIWNDAKQRWEWMDPPKGPNDWPDALKMCHVLFYLMRPALVAEDHARREAELAAQLEKDKQKQA